MIRAGLLRHRVTVEKPVKVKEPGYGTSSTVWSYVMDYRCRIEPLNGTELFRARQVLADVTHKVTGRWSAQITPDCRLVLSDGRILEIGSAVNVGERDRELEIMATERVN